MSASDDFPEEFTIQRVRLPSAMNLADLQPTQIAAYFRSNPDQAKELLQESYDKRYTPSSFITEEGDRYEVGWYSKREGCTCVRQFSNLADAATDYLLLSLRRVRWNPRQATL
jgi:hypothetical protein